MAKVGGPENSPLRGPEGALAIGQRIQDLLVEIGEKPFLVYHDLDESDFGPIIEQIESLTGVEDRQKEVLFSALDKLIVLVHDAKFGPYASDTTPTLHRPEYTVAPIDSGEPLTAETVRSLAQALQPNGGGVRFERISESEWDYRPDENGQCVVLMDRSLVTEEMVANIKGVINKFGLQIVAENRTPFNNVEAVEALALPERPETKIIRKEDSILLVQVGDYYFTITRNEDQTFDIEMGIFENRSVMGAYRDVDSERLKGEVRAGMEAFGYWDEVGFSEVIRQAELLEHSPPGKNRL